MPEDDPHLVDDAAFAESCGETLDRILDLDTWERDPDLAAICRRIEAEVGEAAAVENELSAQARRIVLARLADSTRLYAPPNAGVFRATPEQLQSVWRKALFNGGVEACDATCKPFDTLPVSITQVGVCLTTYQGSVQQFSHRLFQRDLRVRSGDLLEDVLALLDRRAGGGNDSQQVQGVTVLARRGIMAYAERAALAYKSQAPWRMGHGHVAPYELLTGSGSMHLLRSSLTVLSDLIGTHKRFVFVPSDAADRRLLTIGYALRAGEFAVITTAEQQLLSFVENGHYSKPERESALAFCREFGKQIAVGAYRASEAAPAHLFYSHVDHSHEAALIVLSDSLLQEHRSFPLLIDLADRQCRASFGNDIFDGAIQSAYAHAGAPFRYLGERQTRG
jgi:hypothetical protein